MDSTKKHHKEKNVEKEARSHHQIISKKKATSDDLPSHSRTDKDEHNPPHEHKRSSKNEHSGKALINVRKNRDSTQAGNSKSSGSDIENEHHGKHRHHRKKRQHDEDESFEELSRRKRLIESELNALDQEEAEQERARKRRSTRNRSEGHSSRPRAEQPVHVKQEPVSDDDDNNGNRSRRQRRISKMRHRRGSSGSNSEHHEWGKSGDSKSSKTEKEKVKPNFETSGKLTEDTNTYNGVVIKYNEPAEARKPRRKWRMYPFKGETSLPFIPVHRQSAYLLGRSRLIADIPIDHPSCSKQHAVLQFRLLPYERPDGTTGKSVRPYIIDLDSSNGTYVNNKRIEPRRYVELLEKDVLKFGFSTRVYVLLHEESQNEDVES